MKYLRRLMGWLTVVLLVAALVTGRVIITFAEAMNLTNIRIVLKGGMAYRAQVILGMEDGSERDKFFTGTALYGSDADSQEKLYGSDADSLKERYADYSIRGINHNLDIGFVWVWPRWGDHTSERTVAVEVTESIPSIDGRVRASAAERIVQTRGAEAVYPPRWQETRYRVTLEQDPQNQQWRIRSIEPIGGTGQGANP